MTHFSACAVEVRFSWYAIAPNNGTTKQQQCALQTLKKNGVSLALDAAGFIPGESQVMAGVQLGVSAASFTNSLMTASDNPNGAAIGATSSIVGAQITGVGMAAKSMGVSWAKAVLICPQSPHTCEIS